MAILWRISNHLDLAGLGGRYFASRWSSRGRRIVYLAESPTGALLEVLVHLEFLEDKSPPETYTLLRVEFLDELGVKAIHPGDGAWKQDISRTRSLGDEWLDGMETPLARVPSAIVPETWNLLLNPLHPDAGWVGIVDVIREPYDRRLLR